MDEYPNNWETYATDPVNGITVRRMAVPGGYSVIVEDTYFQSNIYITGNSITSLDENGNINILPNGTGNINLLTAGNINLIGYGLNLNFSKDLDLNVGGKANIDIVGNLGIGIGEDLTIGARNVTAIFTGDLDLTVNDIAITSNDYFTVEADLGLGLYSDSGYVSSISNTYTTIQSTAGNVNIISATEIDLTSTLIIDVNATTSMTIDCGTSLTITTGTGMFY